METVSAFAGSVTLAVPSSFSSIQLLCGIFWWLMRTMKSLVAMGLPVRPSIMRRVMTLSALPDGAGTAAQRTGNRAERARRAGRRRNFMPYQNSLTWLPCGVWLAVGTVLSGTRVDIIDSGIRLVERVHGIACVRDPCGVAVGHGVLRDFLQVPLLNKLVERLGGLLLVHRVGVYGGAKDLEILS